MKNINKSLFYQIKTSANHELLDFVGYNSNSTLNNYYKLSKENTYLTEKEIDFLTNISSNFDNFIKLNYSKHYKPNKVNVSENNYLVAIGNNSILLSKSIWNLLNHPLHFKRRHIEEIIDKNRRNIKRISEEKKLYKRKTHRDYIFYRVENSLFIVLLLLSYSKHYKIELIDNLSSILHLFILSLTENEKLVLSSIKTKLCLLQH